MIWLVKITNFYFDMFRIMISSLRFLLDYENIDDDDDSDASGSDDEDSKKVSQVVINREAVYKVNTLLVVDGSFHLYSCLYNFHHYEQV